MDTTKKLFLLLSVMAAIGVKAQDEKPKLKDLLYGGKLKKDSSGVIRKTDDLAANIDTSYKEPEPEKATVIAVIPADTSKVAITAPPDTKTATVESANTGNLNNAGSVNAGTVATGTVATAAEGAIVTAPVTSGAAPAKT